MKIDDKRISDLKEKIKLIYKRYNGEVRDKKVTIKDLADLFMIKVNSERLRDYSLTTICCGDWDENIFIEMRDNRKSIIYSSRFTDQITPLNRGGDSYSYVEVLEIYRGNGEIEHKKVYDATSKQMIVETIKVPYGFRGDLQFLRSYPYAPLGIEDIHFSLSLILPGLDEHKLLSEQIVLQRNSIKIRNEMRLPTLFDQKTTVIPLVNYAFKQKNRQDKYWYTKPGNLIYGVADYDKEGYCYAYHGIVLEHVDKDMMRCLPITMSKDEYDFIKEDEDTTAAIVFSGGTEETRNRHLLKVKKVNGNLNVLYSSSVEFQDTLQDQFSISSSGNNLSLEDIEKLIHYLSSNYDNDFIRIVNEDLQVYIGRLEIRNGLKEETRDELDSRDLIDCDFNLLIQSMIKDNNEKNKYLQIMQSEYKEMSKNADKGYSKKKESNS